MEPLQQVTNVGNGTYQHCITLRQDSSTPAWTAAAYTQSVFLVGIPPRTVITGVVAKLVKQFVAFGMSLCTVTLGGKSQLDSTITSDNFYMPSFSCTQAVDISGIYNTLPLTSFMYWSPNAILTTDPQDLRAVFTSTGAFLNTITSGEIELTITYRLL